MERLVPLTKILMTLAVSVWAIFLRDWMSLMALVCRRISSALVDRLIMETIQGCICFNRIRRILRRCSILR